MYILEQLIETQLKETYSDEQLANFYETFPDNIHIYKQENETAFDTLYSFIDFVKFKEAILLFKSVSHSQNIVSAENCE